MIGSRPAPALPSLKLLERTLLIAGVLLLGWYLVQQVATMYDQAAASRQLEEVRMPLVSARAGAPAARREPLVRGAVVGRIEMPRLGVSAIVREGDDAGTLRRAVGHIPETALPGEPGNAGLAGHRDTFFRGLRNVRAGDRVVVTTPAGRVHYRVRSTQIVQPTDVSVLDPTPGSTLTLVTCYPFNYIGAAPKRFIVRAQLDTAPE